MPPPPDRRVTLSFYADDLRALRRLTLALQEAGADVDRLDALRLALFSATEAQLFARTVTQEESDAASRNPSEAIAARLTIVLPGVILKKLGRVVADLARKDIDTDRTFLIRAALHATHDIKKLRLAIPALEKAFPDKRALRPHRG